MRKKVTVALSGDGGDEVFAGYFQRYSMTRFEDGIRRRIPSVLRSSLLSPLANIYPDLEGLPRPLRLKFFLKNLSLPMVEAYFRDMSFYFKSEMKQGLYKPEFAAQVRSQQALEFMKKHYAELPDVEALSAAQYLDTMMYLPEDILVKVDRMSMAHSLEVRAPILDHKLMEFAAGLPPEWKLKGNVSKYIFKRLLAKKLPESILNRKKQGFRLPVSEWLRGGLKDYAHDILTSQENGFDNYFDLQYIKGMWDEHQRGAKDNANILWGLMMLGLWWKTIHQKPYTPSSSLE
jgi:asparagine synthase (glutamine-hydrolysing)